MPNGWKARKLQDATLQQVGNLIEKMTSPEWKLGLQGKSQEEKAKAAHALAEVQQLRVKLENAQLADISDKLVANEAELTHGTADLNQALTKLDNIEGTLTAIRSFVNVVARLFTISAVFFLGQ